MRAIVAFSHVDLPEVKTSRDGRTVTLTILDAEDQVEITMDQETARVVALHLGIGLEEKR